MGRPAVVLVALASCASPDPARDRADILWRRFEDGWKIVHDPTSSRP